MLVGDAPQGPPAALAVVLLGVTVVGIADGLSQAAVFGEAARLPPQYTHVGGFALVATRLPHQKRC